MSSPRQDVDGYPVLGTYRRDRMVNYDEIFFKCIRTEQRAYTANAERSQKLKYLLRRLQSIGP